MKAERRHELKINTLDQALTNMRQRGRRMAMTAAAVVAAAILIGLLIHNRLVATQNRAIRVADDLAVAREDIDQIKLLTSRGLDASQSAELYLDVTSRINAILAAVGEGNPKAAAEALVARGDAAWNMAVAAAATTQPYMNQQSPSDLQKSAQTAYQQVVSGYPQQHFAVASARLGLAAIAENGHDWDQARQQYQSVIDDPQSGDLLIVLARGMLSTVDGLQRPPLIGQIPAATTEPATRKSQS